MAARKFTPNTLAPQLSRKKLRAIGGTEIPRTLESALDRGFEAIGHDAITKSVRGNVEMLKGTATFRQDGLPWLECPVTLTMSYDWPRLRANQRTSLFKL